MFSTLLENFCQFHQIRNCHLQTFSIWKSLKFVVWEGVNLRIYGKSGGVTSLQNDKCQTVVIWNYGNCLWKHWKHCGKRRKCWLLAFSYFSQGLYRSYFYTSKLREFADSIIWYHPSDMIINGRKEYSKPFLTLSQTSPGFYVSALRLLKTMWEKEKLLGTTRACLGKG